MIDPAVQAWQIPILVTAAIVLVEIAANAVLRRRGSLVVDKRVRTGALGMLLVLTVVVFVVALGPSLAESLSSVAAAVAAMVALWLTYRSYQSPTEAGRNGTGGPADSSGQSAADSSGQSAADSSDQSPADAPEQAPADPADRPSPVPPQTAGDRPAGTAGAVGVPGPRVGPVAPIWPPRLRWLRPRRKARRRG
jgi:hypothetical protein